MYRQFGDDVTIYPACLFTTRVTSNKSMNIITEVTDEKLGPAFHIYLMNV